MTFKSIRQYNSMKKPSWKKTLYNLPLNSSLTALVVDEIAALSLHLHNCHPSAKSLAVRTSSKWFQICWAPFTVSGKTITKFESLLCHRLVEYWKHYLSRSKNDQNLSAGSFSPCKQTCSLPVNGSSTKAYLRIKYQKEIGDPVALTCWHLNGWDVPLSPSLIQSLLLTLPPSFVIFF